MVLKVLVGSGKIFVLSVWFLVLLFKGVNFSEILMFIFIKKVIVEMKERILDYLKIL